MSDLYDTDILEWSERQGALLRRIATGERVNDADVDWPNIVEEIESVGNEQLHAVESLLVQALVHTLNAEKLGRWRGTRRHGGLTVAAAIRACAVSLGNSIPWTVVDCTWASAGRARAAHAGAGVHQGGSDRMAPGYGCSAERSIPIVGGLDARPNLIC